jgi:hypothetical protein
MVGARGLEPLASTVSKNESSAYPSNYGPSHAIWCQRTHSRITQLVSQFQSAAGLDYLGVGLLEIGAPHLELRAFLYGSALKRFSLRE